MKEFPLCLRTADNMENLIFWVISCCVLHNVLLHTGDIWTSANGTMSTEDHDVELFVPESEATLTGIAFREALKKTLPPPHN